MKCVVGGKHMCVEWLGLMSRWIDERLRSGCVDGRRVKIQEMCYVMEGDKFESSNM